MRALNVSHLAGLALAAAALACSPTVGSIGAVLSQQKETGRLVVRDTPPGMAAARGGLKEGDEIIAVDGVDVRDLSPEEVQQALRGPVGTTVSLTVVRDRTDVHRVSVVRGPFKK